MFESPAPMDCWRGPRVVIPRPSARLGFAKGSIPTGRHTTRSASVNTVTNAAGPGVEVPTRRCGRDFRTSGDRSTRTDADLL